MFCITKKSAYKKLNQKNNQTNSQETKILFRLFLNIFIYLFKYYCHTTLTSSAIGKNIDATIHHISTATKAINIGSITAIKIAILDFKRVS
ncbi:MAG: hypothetical protein WCG25_02955 [bacterium]